MCLVQRRKVYMILTGNIMERYHLEETRSSVNWDVTWNKLVVINDCRDNLSVTASRDP
jgi:hypothetical protein